MELTPFLNYLHRYPSICYSYFVYLIHYTLLGVPSVSGHTKSYKKKA